MSQPMSTTTMSGADTTKGVSASGSKQSLKSNTSSSSGKALDSARKQTASPPVEGQNRKSQPPQQKAWTGTNPITQRPSGVIPNGTDKNTSRPASQQLQPKTVAETNGDKHAYDRALFLFANFTGCEATLTMKNGEQFTGIFSGGSFDNASKQQYVMKMVKRTRQPAQQQVNGTASELSGESEYIGDGEDHVMAFDQEDTTDLSVANVAPMPTHSQQNGSISSFRTDTEISGRDPAMPRERELQRWDAGTDAAMDISLEDSGETGWDQFAANERMYGVSTTYDENIYTTQIDYSDPKYKQREAQAARIAREIEGSAAANAHVAEERRQDALRGEIGLDEEEKYSGVRRDGSALPKRAVGAYVPPSQRPLTNAPTVPGAPFDPAIISSSLAKPGGSTERSLEQPKPSASATTETSKTATEATANDAKATQQTPAKKSEVTTEDHVRGVADSFRQFANTEKLRIRQVQEQKRSAQRAEKNVKINDLKKFAANFKLNSRIPDDLVPILAKDADKQKEIQRKAEEAWKDEENKGKDEKSSVGASSPAPSAASSVAVAQSGKSDTQHMPFNRNRVSASGRPQQPIPGVQMQSPRSNIGTRDNRAFGNLPNFPPRPQPLPADIRIPGGPSHPPAPMDAGPLSPGAATRLNAGAKAFEFRPAAHAFTPTGTTPSPQRSAVAENTEFFSKDKSAKDITDDEKKTAFSPIKHAIKEPTDDKKTDWSHRGGVPEAFRTAPTWMKENQEFVSYQRSIPKAPTPSQTHSQMNTPNPNSGQMPHVQQMPPHMHATQVTPSSRPPYMPHQQMPPNMTPHGQGQFGPGMHGFGNNGSVQSSPRFQGANVAFNGQIPNSMGMPQFGGQQFNGQQMGMPYPGMSPSMGYRAVNMPNMPPGAGGMMMMPGGQAQHGHMPMAQYHRAPHQPFQPQMGVPMAQQGSTQGYPLPPHQQMQNPPQQQQSYSPMPPHAMPHAPHLHQQQQSPYSNSSPRPAHLMQHTASHQGFNPQHMQGYPPPQQQGGGGWAQPHAHGMQYRQMSAGYAAMTPRSQQAVPHGMQPSPGQGGDEGK